MNELDIDALRIKDWQPKVKPVRKKTSARSKYFLKGPVPLKWLTVAGNLPGKALHVGIVLWLWAGIEKRTSVKLSSFRLEPMGVSRHSSYRALAALEGAGLVSVVRKQGSGPLVTILEAPGAGDLAITPNDSLKT